MRGTKTRASLATKRSIIGAVAMAWALSFAATAQAQDFFQSLFGSFSSGAPSRERSIRSLPFAIDDSNDEQRAPRSYAPRNSYSRAGTGGGQAFCVRTCDGRFFPISAADGQSRTASCKNFCPASETKVFYGGTIESASDNGKSYSDLPNAFKYRTELVPGCTCNGKDQIGLAPVKIENDPTLRRGDIVSGAEGLMVSRAGADRRGAALNMSPATAAVRAKYARLPVLASD